MRKTIKDKEQNDYVIFMTMYVIGHKSPDTDSICASIAYADLKRQLGEEEEVKAARSGDINDETSFILERFNVEAPETLPGCDGRQIILVDHNEETQREDSIKDDEVIEILDHHKINLSTSTAIRVVTEPLGSTCTIIADMYMYNDAELSKDMAGILLGAILSDTVIFKSPITTETDRIVAEQLATIAGIDDIEQFGIEIFKAKSSWSEYSTRDIITMDYKDFDMNGKKIGIGQVETVDPTELNDRKDDFISDMKSIAEDKDLDLIMVLITDIMKGSCLAFVVGRESDAIEKAFGKPVEYDQIYLEGVLSRKKQVVPPLEKVFSE